VLGVAQHPSGSDWPQYILGAFVLQHPEHLHSYPDWREPLYPWLLGLVADGGSYLEAGRILGTCSVLLLILGAALAGRALAGAWAGGAAALLVLTLPAVIGGSNWINHYALLAAFTGLALALAAATARWRLLVLAPFCGLAAGLAWATDARGVAAVAAVLVVAVGVTRLKRWRWSLGLLLLLGAGIAVGPVLSKGLSVVERKPFSEQVEVQRETILREIRDQGFSEPLKAACADPEQGAGVLSGACARALLRENLRRMSAQGQLPAPVPLLGLLVLAAAALSRRREELFSALGVFLVPAGAFLVGAAWVVYQDRYLLQFAVPLACLVPVALLRAAGFLEGRWPRLQRWSTVVALVALAVVVALALRSSPVRLGPLLAGRPPGEGPAPRGKGHGKPRGLPVTPDDQLGNMVDWFKQAMGPEDLFYDCSHHGLETLWLPSQVHPPPVIPNQDLCLQLIRTPPAGLTWLVTPTDSSFPLDPAASGWQSVPSRAGWLPRLAAWKRQGSGSLAPVPRGPPAP